MKGTPCSISHSMARRTFHDEAGGARIVEVDASDEGVADVGFDRILVIEHRCDTPLSPARGAVFQGALAHQSNPAMIGKAQGGRLAGQAAADDQYVVMHQRDNPSAKSGANIARAQGQAAHRGYIGSHRLHVWHSWPAWAGVYSPHPKSDEMPIRMSEREIDQQLVEKAQQGDRQAFDTLVAKYQRKLARLVARLVKDNAEVEDVVQEAFIKAYRALPTFRGESAFYTWLYRIGVNTAKNYLVSQGRRAPTTTEFTHDV